MDTPDDVLFEIFQWAVAASDGIPSVREAPINISHTCRRWRDVVLSQGRFWARLNCIAPAKIHIRLATLYLERSARANLKFSISQATESSSEVDRDTWRELLLKKQSQWDILKMHSAPYLTDDSLWTALRLEPLIYGHRKSSRLESLPSLKELVFSDEFPFGIENIDTKGATKTLPLFLVPHPSSMDQPLAPSITHLACSRLRGSRNEQRGLWAMLWQCPNLEELKLFFDSKGEEAMGDDEPICVLSKLQVLEVEDTRSRDGEPQTIFFLRRIAVPALRKFTINFFSADEDYSVYVAMRDLLTRPEYAPTILEADIGINKLDAGGDSERPWLLGLLRALHSVTDLALCISENWDVALDLLSDFDEDNEEDIPLCPRLEVLTIWGGNMVDMPAEYLDSVLSPRFRYSNIFRAVVRICDDGSEEADREAYFASLESNEDLGRWKEEDRLVIE